MLSLWSLVDDYENNLMMMIFMIIQTMRMITLYCNHNSNNSNGDDDDDDDDDDNNNDDNDKIMYIYIYIDSSLKGNCWWCDDKENMLNDMYSHVSIVYVYLRMWDKWPSSCTNLLRTWTSIRIYIYIHTHAYPRLVEKCSMSRSMCQFNKKLWNKYDQFTVLNNKTSNIEQTTIYIYILYTITKNGIYNYKTTEQIPPPRRHQRRSKARGSAPCHVLSGPFWGPFGGDVHRKTRVLP